MKVPPLNLRREDVPDLSTGERTEKLLRALNAFGAAAEPLLNGGLTFANLRSFAKDVTFTATGNNTIDPIRIKNEIGAAPRHVFLTRAVSLVSGREAPVSLGNPAWATAGDQIVLSAFANVLAATKYRVTILVVAE